jgi:hypothetical protein
VTVAAIVFHAQRGLRAALLEAEFDDSERALEILAELRDWLDRWLAELEESAA